MPLDWSILRTDQPVDIAGNFARGYQVASTLIDKFHERNALATLAQAPNDPSALATLYQVNPSLGQHFEERGQELATAQRRAATADQYTTDPVGARQAALGAGDFDLAKQFSELDADTQKRAADFWEKAGPIAYKLKQTADPAQRQALWAEAKPILQSEGVNQQLLDHFDPTNDAQLDAAVVTSQKVSDLVNQGKPEEFNVEAGAARYARDPVTNEIHMIIAPNPGDQPAGAPANLPRVSSPAEAAKLPPGSKFELPDGRIGTVPGGQSGASSTGGFSMTNNPGALRVPGSMKFQTFSSPAEGIQAQQALLGRYMNRGLNNVSSIVETYAPRRSRGGDNSDASVNNYIAYVSRRLGVNPQDALSPALLPQLSQAMREFETGRRAD